MPTTLQRARALRKNSTDVERLLWKHLRAKRLAQWKFKRQQPVGLYIVDFVCFEARLIVELDGGHHADQLEYDEKRTTWLESQGFIVSRFWNNEVIENLVSRTGNSGTNETAGFFRQARRRPAAVWGIRQGAATTHGGKRRCFMFRYFWFVTLEGVMQGIVDSLCAPTLSPHPSPVKGEGRQP